MHHPYESFSTTVQRLIQQAADDPDVLTIKMTLYRTSGDSPIVQALIRAAESGKQVVVLVEIKARFDERANIVWAKALERAGAHVAYGLLGLKTHSKCTLVIRRESGGLRRYAHIGTGNYNHKTARIYTDLGLLTADRVLTGDVTDLFNVLTGVARKDRYRELLVAPEVDATEARGSHRRRGRATSRARRRPHHPQVQRLRRPADDPEAVWGQPGRRAHRPDRAWHVLAPAGSTGLQRVHPGALDRGPLPRALAHLRASARAIASATSSARQI